MRGKSLFTLPFRSERGGESKRPCSGARKLLWRVIDTMPGVGGDDLGFFNDTRRKVALEVR